jgi:P27 family predicted phage terminase small subunit
MESRVYNGNKPKSLTVQLAEGDPRKIGKRKLARRASAEPKATHVLPPCPRHLRGRARAQWNLWRGELEVMNLGSRPDAAMLEGACVHYARAVEADLIIAAAGQIVEEPILNALEIVVGTRLKTNPAVAISAKSWLLCKAFCSEFGFSPVSRTRLAVEKPNVEEQDLMAVLSRPRTPRALVAQPKGGAVQRGYDEHSDL